MQNCAKTYLQHAASLQKNSAKVRHSRKTLTQSNLHEKDAHKTAVVEAMLAPESDEEIEEKVFISNTKADAILKLTQTFESLELGLRID